MGVAFGCVGNTIRLRSGKYLSLDSPQPEQFDFSDIAGALSKICRFGGQVERFYSVAEHCYHCAKLAENDGLSVDALKAILLHDAAEAFIGDVVKPLKIMLPNYAAIEWNMEAAIERKFGVNFTEHAQAIREIDHAMLIAERRAMFTADDVQWHGEGEVRRLYVEFRRWDPVNAESFFVMRANALGIQTKAAG